MAAYDDNVEDGVVTVSGDPDLGVIGIGHSCPSGEEFLEVRV